MKHDLLVRLDNITSDVDDLQSLVNLRLIPCDAATMQLFYWRAGRFLFVNNDILMDEGDATGGSIKPIQAFSLILNFSWNKDETS